MNQSIIFFCIIILLIPEILFAQQWFYETVDNSVNVGWYSSIALDAFDYAHISYFDAPSNALKYAYWTGSEWEIQTVDTGISPDELDGSTSIAVDSQGFPHIAYSTEHGNPGDTIRYAYWDGAVWQKTDVVDNGWSLIFCSLALDSSEYPHICWCHDTGNALKYAYWDGINWQITSVEESMCTGYCSSIALDSSYYPHISYIDAWNGLLKYACWDGIDWEIVSVDSPGYYGFEGIDTSIAIDSLDLPHIAYTYWNTDDLRYAHYNGIDWEITTVDNQGITGKEPSIAVDSLNHPHISYRSASPSGLIYARWTGSDWEHTTVDDNDNVGQQSSIALGTLDNPHISYGIGGTSTLEYAWYDPGLSVDPFSVHEQTLQLILAEPYPVPAQYAVTFGYTLPNDCPIELNVYNIVGRRVITLVNSRQSTGIHELIYDCTDISDGVYIVELKTGKFSETRCFVIIR